MRRPPYRRSTPALSKLPGSLKHRAASFQCRPDVIAALHALDWKLGIVDLRDLLSYQWNVADLDALKKAEDSRPEGSRHPLLLLPSGPGNQINAAGRIDQTRMGITLSSRDPCRRDPRYAQIIVQFENGDREILKGSEFDLGPRRNLMEMRSEFGLDLVVVDAQVDLLRSPRGDRDGRQYQQGKGTRQDALGAPKANLH